MAACGHVAFLVITQTVEGTTTSLARERVKLCCDLPAGHDGPHRDSTQDEQWEGAPDKIATLLRHEDGT